MRRRQFEVNCQPFFLNHRASLTLVGGITNADFHQHRSSFFCFESNSPNGVNFLHVHIARHRQESLRVVRPVSYRRWPPLRIRPATDLVRRSWSVRSGCGPLGAGECRTRFFEQLRALWPAAKSST